MASFGRGRGYAGGGGFNSFSGVRLKASNRGRLDPDPADFDVDFSSSLEAGACQNMRIACKRFRGVAQVGLTLARSILVQV